MACSSVDRDVKRQGLLGGAVAVFCLVTKDQIVVGNVGDCRCILIEHKKKEIVLNRDDNNNNNDNDKTVAVPSAAGAAAGEEESTETSVNKLTESMTQQLSLSGTDGSPAAASPPSKESLLAETSGGGAGTMTVVATALSIDHKADLPDERARIEKAGLNVIKLAYQDDNGKDVTRVKVQLSEGNMVDFSRSFGDFDYKNVRGLPENEQPIIAVPQVQVIDRHAIAPESYLVMACDGVWDVKSNNDVANFVTEQVHRRVAVTDNNKDDADILSSLGNDLVMDCIDSNDNLSTIIVALSQAADMISSAQQQQFYSTMTSPSSPLLPSNKLPFTTPQK